MTLEATTTRSRAVDILDVAERMLQTRGFNAFSYADVADELHLTKPALHYHFRSKAALGDALVLRYSERFFGQLENISASSDDAPTRLTRYVDLYRSVLTANRMCLCGMLAAEFLTLPEEMRGAVVDFFDRNQTWLEGVLRRGVARHELNLTEPFSATAELIIDTLEGSMMISRAHDDPERFERASAKLLASLVG